MDEKSIRDSIQEEMNQFNLKSFPGILPEWFLSNFERAVMEMPQLDVPYRGDTIRDILGKNVNELNFFEVGLITNIWLSVSPKFVDSKIEKYLVKKVALESIRTQWNRLNSAEMERLQRKAHLFKESSRSRIIKN